MFQVGDDFFWNRNEIFSDLQAVQNLFQVDKGGELHTLEVYRTSAKEKNQIFGPQDKFSQIVTHFRSLG